MEQSETPSRELTLEEAVALAIVLQKNAQLVEAQELYRRVLDTAPNHPDALHYAGVLAHQQVRSDDPSHANAHSNLGVLLRATGKPLEAEAAYRTAIRLNPEHVDEHG